LGPPARTQPPSTAWVCSTCAELRRLALLPLLPTTSNAEQPSHAVCHLPHTSMKAVQTVPKPGIDCPRMPDLAQPFCKAAPFETKQPLLGAACLCQRQAGGPPLTDPPRTTSTQHHGSAPSAMCCLQWSLTSMASTPPMTTRMEPRIVDAPPSAAPTAPKTASATVDAPSTTASLRDAWKRVYWNTHITRCRGISGGWTVLLYFRGNAADAIDAAPGVRRVAASEFKPDGARAASSQCSKGVVRRGRAHARLHCRVHHIAALSVFRRFAQ